MFARADVKIVPTPLCYVLFSSAGTSPIQAVGQRAKNCFIRYTAGWGKLTPTRSYRENTSHSVTTSMRADARLDSTKVGLA